MSFVMTLLPSMGAFALFLWIRKWKVEIIPVNTVLMRVKELWLKSAQFALLQIFSSVLLMADLFVVSKILGLETVGEYFLVKKIYLVLASLHFAILLPVWSAYTESVESQDLGWVEKVLKKMAICSVVIFVLGIATMHVIGRSLVYFWTGREITDNTLFLLLGCWGLLYGWCNCFSVFLNATGYVKNQVLLVGLGLVVFLTLSLTLGKAYGTTGICVALVLGCVPAAVFMPIESFRVLRHLRRGCPDHSSRGARVCDG
jgi:O-antigen/teichoic acid export membrane protein